MCIYVHIILCQITHPYPNNCSCKKEKAMSQTAKFFDLTEEDKAPKGDFGGHYCSECMLARDINKLANEIAEICKAQDANFGGCKPWQLNRAHPIKFIIDSEGNASYSVCIMGANGGFCRVEDTMPSFVIAFMQPIIRAPVRGENGKYTHKIDYRVVDAIKKSVYNLLQMDTAEIEITINPNCVIVI